MPGLPVISIDPAVIFLIFLPPLLYQAACKTSWHDLKRQRRPIARLALGLVLFSTFCVAVAAHALIPSMSWAESILLGAIVSPAGRAGRDERGAQPAPVAPGRRILEGESLVNDASALIVYRYALAAVAGGTFVLWQATAQFFIVAGGGVLIGVVVGYIFSLVHRHALNNPTVETALSIIIPFSAYLIAEHLHLSGVLAVVCAGLFISWRSSELFSHETRLRMNNFWEVMVFLLNGLAFIMIGLQLPVILQHIEGYSVARLAEYGVIISLMTIAARMGWIFFFAWLPSFISALTGRAENRRRWKWGEVFVISWAGMRGIVSLAAALALPISFGTEAAFENRDIILFITFTVILATLILQGLSLPFLARLLKAQEPEGKTLREEKELRLAIVASTLAYLAEKLAPEVTPDIAQALKDDLVHQSDYLDYVLRRRKNSGVAEEALGRRDELRAFVSAELALLQHQRELILSMHKEGVFGEDLLEKIEQELDVQHMSLNQKLEFLS